MNRFTALLGLALAVTLSAQAQTAPAFPFTYYIHDTTGQVADYALPSIYQFAATPLGSSSHVVLKVVNTSGAPAFMGTVIVGLSDTSVELDPNFTVSGLSISESVPANGSLLFQINFSPTVTGPIAGYVETTYQVQAPGCSFTSNDPATQCPSGIYTSATLNGTATQPQLVLNYINSSGVTTQLQPSATPLNFGNISTSGTATITFTLANESNVAIAVPTITIPPPTEYTDSAFSLDLSQVPATLAAGASANFTVTFAPGQTGLDTGIIYVGANTYQIQGEGVVITDIDSLQISYVDSTGVRTLPQAATPISFGQTTAGTGSTTSLVFTVTNPATSYNGVAVTGITVTGAAYSITNITGATAFPFGLSPSASIGFTLNFNPPAAGTYAGTLNIGGRSFSLTGQSLNTPLPGLSLAVSPSPLFSQQQASASVQLAAASPLNLTGTISMAFAPSVAKVTSDPAIVFLANNGLQLPISIATGAQSATYNGQSAINFQTGTTAGTITFTVNFPDTPAFTQSYTIPPAIVQITSATAVNANPNIVVNIAGYDNTYSAGNLNFTFYDTTGKAYPPIAYNAAGAFQNLFFGNSNTTGGAFTLQATFPVTGNVAGIGSVAISISNSVGQTNQTLTITQ